MLNDTFFEVLKHEGVVAIATYGIEQHLVNTWNSYIRVTDSRDLLIPVGGMRKTEQNIAVNNNVLLTLGSRDVNGMHGRPGAGFLVRGKSEVLSAGQHFEEMKKLFPWARAVLKIKADSITQTL